MPLLTGLEAPDIYARCRGGLRRCMQAYKGQRTVPLGPCMRVLFEDRLTVSYQTLETRHAERFDPAFDAEENLMRFAHLLPGRRRLCATVMIEVPDAGVRRQCLPMLNDAVHEICLELDGQPPVRARANEDLPDQHRKRLSAVHFLRFDLPDPTRTALLDGVAVGIGCRHAAYGWRQALAPALVQGLQADLGPAAWVTSLVAEFDRLQLGAQ